MIIHGIIYIDLLVKFFVKVLLLVLTYSICYGYCSVGNSSSQPVQGPLVEPLSWTHYLCWLGHGMPSSTIHSCLVMLEGSCQEFRPGPIFIKHLKSNVYVTLNAIGSFQCNLCSHWLIQIFIT